MDNKPYLFEYGGFHPMIEKKGKYISGNVYNHMNETFIKIGNLRVCWDYIQVQKFIISLIMIYHRTIWDPTFVSENCGMTCPEKSSY